VKLFFQCNKGFETHGGCRLQNSPYFCLFKYVRAVKQKVWSEAGTGERDCEEAQKILQAKLQGPVPRKMVKFNPGLSQISSTVFSSLRTCNSRLQITVEPLLRDVVMITQNVTLSNA